jgi:scyllo-inositol 2-dehydrogenase (NADP+)
MSPVNIGIIGFGRIGAEHSVWLASATNAKAVAVADATPARQGLARQRGLVVHSEIDQLLADPSIDAVLVATPTAFHFDHASRALAAGKHVLVEKPMALDLSQSMHLVQDAKRRGLVLSVFHNRRWDVDFLTVKDAIKSGQLGNLINVESRLGQYASCVGPAAKEYRPGWRNEAAFGGGGLYDWGSHFGDQLWGVLHPG